MVRSKTRQVGLIIAVFLSLALSVPVARGQDAAWEGLINAGRNALQQRNFSEAERHFESALEAAERFPSGDPRLGKSYNNLAAVYYAQEDYERAEPLMRRALTQLQETLGPRDSEVAQTMKNLAALYYLQGNRGEAEDLLKQSLAILEEVHGPNHAFVATVLSNLAGLYQAENRYQDAEPLLTRSLEIWENLLGSDHPDVVRSRSLLAQVREAQGDAAPSETVSNDEDVSNEAAPAATAEADAIPSPSPAEAEAEAPAAVDRAAAAEIARAATAVETLTRRAQAEAAAAEVPAPALNPIAGDGVGEAPDVAAGAFDDEDALVPSALSSSADPADDADLAAVEEGDDETSENPAIETAAVDPADSAEDQATAVLNKATSPIGDVSFAVYLSTLWSIDEARRYWQALQDAMPRLLGEKQLELEEVAAGDGGDPFYRVLTKPFLSDPEAQAACEQIKSQLRTHDCNVVVRDGNGVTAGG